MSTSKVKGMTRPEVFAALLSRGASRAVVEFSGGNDEGGPDSITLLDGEEEIAKLQAWWSDGDTVTEAGAELADALCDPIFEEHGTFAGDFDVTGEVIWDAETHTVQMIRDERSEYQHFEEML